MWVWVEKGKRGEKEGWEGRVCGVWRVFGEIFGGGGGGGGGGRGREVVVR